MKLSRLAGVAALLTPLLAFANEANLVLPKLDSQLFMGVNGRAYVEKNYGWDVIISKYERMFTRLRGGSGSAAATTTAHSRRAIAS